MDRELGVMIEDWGLEFEIWDLGLGIRIGNWYLGLGMGIGDRD